MSLFCIVSLRNVSNKHENHSISSEYDVKWGRLPESIDPELREQFAHPLMKMKTHREPRKGKRSKKTLAATDDWTTSFGNLTGWVASVDAVVELSWWGSSKTAALEPFTTTDVLLSASESTTKFCARIDMFRRNTNLATAVIVLPTLTSDLFVFVFHPLWNNTSFTWQCSTFGYRTK